jgi:formylglycine-generating enzyme required for sulfatase activity
MNVLGFYDLGGNVTELMWDGWDDKTGKLLFRGGNWYYSLEYCTVANRRYDPGNRKDGIGFRVALSSVP